MSEARRRSSVDKFGDYRKLVACLPQGYSVVSSVPRSNYLHNYVLSLASSSRMGTPPISNSTRPVGTLGR